MALTYHRASGGLWFLVCLIALFFQAPAQPVRSDFEKISLEQGLSQSIVESIVQDRRGFLWFCTEDGLNRYDGYSFTVFRKSPTGADSISHNHTLATLIDRAGRLWVGTFNGGLNRYDPVTGRFTRFQHDPGRPDSLSHDVVTAICQDRSGALWVGTLGGLNRLSPAWVLGEGGKEPRFERFFYDARDSDSISHDTVRSIFQDREGRLWIGTDGGLNRLRPGPPFRFDRYLRRAGDTSSLGHNTVRVVTQTRDGSLWVGTDGGLDRFEGSSRGSGTDSAQPMFTHFGHDPARPDSLGHDQVFALCEDRAGNLWVGTNGGGLDLLEPGSARFRHFRHDDGDPQSLSHDAVRSVYESVDGTLWIGTYGGGISKLPRGRKEFAHVRAEPDKPGRLNDAIVWCFYQEEDGTLWVGTNGGGLNRRDPANHLFTHYRARPGDPRSLSSDAVRQIVPDEYGFLWIGTNGGGICRFDRQTGQFAPYRHDPGDPASLSHDEIRCLFRDRSGAIWVGTQGGGLDRFVPGPLFTAPPVFQHFRHDERRPSSLASDFVRQVIQDRAGALWICTYGGGWIATIPFKGCFTTIGRRPQG